VTRFREMNSGSLKAMALSTVAILDCWEALGDEARGSSPRTPDRMTCAWQRDRSPSLTSLHERIAYRHCSPC
jgi:hypothetical protein